MKKRFLIILAAVVVALGLTAFVAACDSDAPSANYSVTVALSFTDDGDPVDPVPDVTVKWLKGDEVAGTATTDENGRAAASLPADKYSIALENYGDGYDYTSLSVTAKMRNATIALTAKDVDYTVTVKDKAGNPAAGVTVSFLSGTDVVGAATTDASGAAVKSLPYGNYNVTLSNLPSGNVYGGAEQITGTNPALDFTLIDGVTQEYRITVRSEGGLIFKNQPVTVTNGTALIESGKTDEKGVYTFTAAADSYFIDTTGYPAGYTYDRVELTRDVSEKELVLTSQVIKSAPASNTSYVIGDIIHDYSFQTPYQLGGSVWSSSVSKILEKKKALIINNWGTNCSWCVTEMGAMETVYQKYKDKIELVAVSNYAPYDSDATIRNYYAANGYSFPMMRDKNGLDVKFNVTGWPTTIVIDRFGAIARIESGAIPSEEAWERMILKYIGDDYVQTFTPGEHVSESINTEMAKPDVELDSDHYDKIAETLSKGLKIEWSGEEDESVNAWPFLLGTHETISPEDKVVYASNTGKANSWAILYATVTIEKGKVFTFDYYSDTEEDGDILNVIWDNRIARQISGKSEGWKTCYLYSELVDGTHVVGFVYQKNGSISRGLDNVFIRNVRFCELSDITESTDMLRAASYGGLTSDNKKFNNYVDVSLGEDGYYHVDATKIQPAGYAGVDESPLLLVDVVNATPWSKYSLAEFAVGTDDNDNYAIDCTFTIDGVTKDYRADLLRYMSAAASSDIPGYAPINKFLHDLLVQFMARINGSSTHDKKWLEVCFFYSHYGTTDQADFVGNPIIGLMEETSTPVVAGTVYTADLTRNQNPFPTWIYAFTPTASAVYKIESLLPDSSKDAAQVWIYDDKTTVGKPLVYCGDERVTLDGKNEHNFVAYRYMEAGHKYYIAVAFQMAAYGQLEFKISNVGAAVTQFEPCSSDLYEMVLDENGKVTDKIQLANAIEYVKDTDGYYRAKNPDGSTGDFIYLDVLGDHTSALGTIPLCRLIDYYVDDPATFKKLDYKMFDFRYCVMYYHQTVGIITYDPKVNVMLYDPAHVDYTEILRAYIEAAPTSGEYKGLIKVNQQIVDILRLFFSLRLDGAYDDQIVPAMENEWLRFCWYKRTYNSSNP